MLQNPVTLRIVLATNHLQAFTGSELMVATIAHALRGFGHQVLLYAPFVTPSLFFHPPFADLKWTSDLAQMRDFAPDVCYTQHHTTVVVIRNELPDCPILHSVLGVLPFLEQPPPTDLALAATLCLSEEVYEHVRQQSHNGGELKIFRNLIDDALFSFDDSPAAQPRKVVLHTYKLDASAIARIRTACDIAGLELLDLRPAHPGATTYHEIPALIMRGDIVVATGRSAIEAMCAQRAVLVMADCGEDGLITPTNFGILSQSNFSGRASRRRLTAEELAQEFRNYDRDAIVDLAQLARRHFGLSHRLSEINDLFIGASTAVPRTPDSDEHRHREYLAKTIGTILHFCRSGITTGSSAFAGAEAADGWVVTAQNAWLAGDTNKALECFWKAFQSDRADASALNGLVSLLLCFLAAAKDVEQEDRRKTLQALLALHPANEWAIEELSKTDRPVS